MLILPAGLMASDAAYDDVQAKVRISILSRRIKQIQDKSLKEIVMNFSEGSVANDTNNGDRFDIKKISIILENNKLSFIADNKKMEGQFHLIISSAKKDDVFSVSFADEERVYPVPLEIIIEENDLNLIIREDMLRYAYDAAYAEYRKVKNEQQEAMAALTLIILSRSVMAKDIHRHNNFDFCDLAHCQTYAGRKSKYVEFTSKFPWIINSEHVHEMLHFHAICGGHTLGNKVFGPATEQQTGVKDWLIHDGEFLCRYKADDWEASIAANELTKLILKRNIMAAGNPVSVQYDESKLIIDLKIADDQYSFSPEDFRLRINRVRGWDFIKSNNYQVVKKNKDGTEYFIFRGKGLGHGAGLCQRGALQLAERGYSRYEILEHYFPGIEFMQYGKADIPTPPDFSFFVFSLITGEVENSSHENILIREIPPGSLFKLIVSLYLATERPDLLKEYVYNCTHNSDPNIPSKCWTPEGHGKVNFTQALSNSCNLYFASLYQVIDQDKFRKFFDKLCLCLHIESKLPKIKNNSEFSHLLAGLDYRVRFTVKDFIPVARLLSLSQTNDADIESFKKTMSLESRTIIFKALLDTMQSGTVTYEYKSTGAALNGKSPESGNINPKIKNPPAYPCEYTWGKTATVIDGTSKQTVYGIFLGGCNEKGIVAVMRNSNGRKTAKIAATHLF